MKPFINSDPHAWLRPIYAQLRRQGPFALLSPHHQFDALCNAAEDLSPSKVALIRQYNATTQAALLDHLASTYRDQPEPTRETELWRVRKGARELWYQAVYLPTGIDVRLMEQDGFRRTQLATDAPNAGKLADSWLVALLDVGWIVVDRRDSARWSNTNA